MERRKLPWGADVGEVEAGIYRASKVGCSSAIKGGNVQAKPPPVRAPWHKHQSRFGQVLID